MLFIHIRKSLKDIALLLVLPVILSACGADNIQTKASPLEPKPSEYFMTYKVNGKRVTLNLAIVRNFQNDVRYRIEGASRVQGDVNVVIIQHNDGPPRAGTFSTNEGNLIFTLGMNDEAGSWSTLNFTDMSFGIGEFTISEITDTYAKGTFNFIADWGGEDAPDKRFEITDGRFKARMGHPF